MPRKEIHLHTGPKRRPPGQTTRTVSATPFSGLGTKKITSGMTATSKVSSGKDCAIASPWRNCATRDAGRVRAKASCASDGSIPYTEIGAQRSTSISVKAPLPRLRAETLQLPVWMEPNESNRYEDNCFDGSDAKKRDSNGAGRREQNTEKENDRKQRSQQNSQR
jgi:hypothetical protein